MKKLLYLLLLLPLAFMASCSDDDDTPNVEITVTFENAAMGSDNVMYAVQEKDYPFKVQSITVKPLSGKAAGLSMVGYSLDYEPLGVAAVEPFGVNLGSLPLGNHSRASCSSTSRLWRKLQTSPVSLNSVPSLQASPSNPKRNEIDLPR